MVDEFLVRHKALQGQPEITHDVASSESCGICELVESVRVLNQEIDRLRDFEEEVRLLYARLTDLMPCGHHKGCLRAGYEDHPRYGVHDDYCAACWEKESHEMR